MLEFKRSEKCEACGDLVTTVEDTGCGMNEVTKKSIF
jgi:hypothetical protein